MSQYLYPDCVIMVFAKTPIAGQVKTRMQPVLTPEQSAELHQQMIEHMLVQAVDSRLAPVQLWVGSEDDYWHKLLERFPVSLHIQRGGDLGERLTVGFEEALVDYGHAIVVGTDCPFLNYDYLEQACQALRSNNQCVICPAYDGGYVMIGLNKMPAGFLTGIEWGSGKVLKQTQEKIEAMGLIHTELTMVHDIDRPTDLKHLAELAEFKRWLSFDPC